MIQSGDHARKDTGKVNDLTKDEILAGYKSLMEAYNIDQINETYFYNMVAKLS